MLLSAKVENGSIALFFVVFVQGFYERYFARFPWEWGKSGSAPATPLGAC